MTPAVWLVTIWLGFSLLNFALSVITWLAIRRQSKIFIMLLGSGGAISKPEHEDEGLKIKGRLW